MCHYLTYKKMEAKAIKSRVLKLAPIKWRELEFIQDENFKEWINDGYKKLIESLLKFQFVDPFKVWKDGKKIYCSECNNKIFKLL